LKPFAAKENEMAKSREIEFTIDLEGNIEGEAFDFDGQGCHEALDAYQRAAGKNVTSKKKAEFYKNKVKVGTQNKCKS